MLEPVTSIDECVARHNSEPKPSIGTKSADVCDDQQKGIRANSWLSSIPKRRKRFTDRVEPVDRTALFGAMPRGCAPLPRQVVASSNENSETLGPLSERALATLQD